MKSEFERYMAIDGYKVDNITKLIKEKEKYRKGFDILMDYFDSISDEEKPEVDRQLKEIGL